MADQTDMEARIRAIEDIEAIKQVKARYWRCVDKKLWTELEEVFAEDATADYGPDLKFQGRKAIIDFLIASLGGEAQVSFHGGHNPEIRLTSVTTATATWPIQAFVLVDPNTRVEDWGHYEDEYVKVDGQWKKKSVKIVPILQEWSMKKRPRP